MTAIDSDFSERHEPTNSERPPAKRRSLLLEEPDAVRRRLLDLLFEGRI